MPLAIDILNASTGVVILVLILVANYYQFKIRRRFSGVIGKIMFWYSLGLATMLAVAILDWIMFSLRFDFITVTLAGRFFDIVAIACFLKGTLVIR